MSMSDYASKLWCTKMSYLTIEAPSLHSTNDIQAQEHSGIIDSALQPSRRFKSAIREVI